MPDPTPAAPDIEDGGCDICDDPKCYRNLPTRAPMRNPMADFERFYWSIRMRAARIVCRLRGHRITGGKTWTEYGDEYIRYCDRCGEDDL